ncbi:B-box zinc finger protein [Mucilaginibacter agri]|uniref:B box-type domain-containing protein n=1 Tax=Mucilaginibacter agri TaxID=2695265 RepID=A0A966DUQ3_9SPHI|nr:hypothetical protein [Mucilaginibacter agri]NCD70691.1 hypothetical protein [Mucilaginibacter agri]
MHCYTHPNQQANAICKNCNKGVCPLCAIELEDGIACSEHCAEKVKMINGMINRNQSIQGKTKGAYYRAAFIYGALGCLFFATAFMYSDLKFYGFAAGSIFIIGAVLTIISGRKMSRSN